MPDPTVVLPVPDTPVTMINMTKVSKKETPLEMI